jgi:UDP-N-acetylglucosamine--N-acetylmuramyl-(pentapeptide) pyrophosphoryl-undecaprenol N-acetylglucosamine transferase
MAEAPSDDALRPATFDAGRPAHHALLAAGGTGGHVFPALAIATALAARGWRVSVVGSARGLEARLVPERGIPFHVLAARPFVGGGPLAKARALLTLGRSATAAARLVRRLGAEVVVGTGGYVSAPAVAGARLARRPVLLVEPNAVPGAANRWLSRWAAGAAIGFPGAAAGLRCRTWLTGVPVRAEFFDLPALAPEAPPSLLVLGGSQGSRQLNTLLPEAVAQARRELPALRVRHQAGERHAAATAEAYARLGLADAVEVVPFVSDVARAMGAAQLVVARAGALTIAELCAAGRPAILVPLQIAAGHQLHNAQALAAAGAARVLTGEVEPAALVAALVELYGAPEQLRAMGRAARALARPGAAAAIAERVEDLGASGAERGAW